MSNSTVRKLKTSELNRLEAAALKAAPRVELSVFLDNVRSGLNVGSIFRTADGFRLRHVYLSGITVQPPHREVLKTAIGAEQTVPYTYFENSFDGLLSLKEAGYMIAVVEQTTESVALQDWQPKRDQRWVAVLGNEVRGVSDDLLALADVCLEVPQFGAKHSFNVSICAAIISWEYMRSCGLSGLE